MEDPPKIEEQLAALKKELAAAIGQADRGELEDVDEGLADRVRAAGLKKLEAWRDVNGV
jgi:hypothetical protein